MDHAAILREAHYVRQDLTAFRKSRDVMFARMREMEGENTRRLEEFEQWACTQVIMNAFVLAIVRCEGLLEDYQVMLDQLGPAPVLELVRADKEDEND